MPLDDNKTQPGAEVAVDNVPVIMVRVQQRVGDGARVIDFQTHIASDVPAAEHHALLDRLARLADRQVAIDELKALEKQLHNGEAEGDRVGAVRKADLAKALAELEQADAAHKDAFNRELEEHESGGRRGEYRESPRVKKLGENVAALEKRRDEIRTDIEVAGQTHADNLRLHRQKIADKRAEIERLAKDE